MKSVFGLKTAWVRAALSLTVMTAVPLECHAFSCGVLFGGGSRLGSIRTENLPASDSPFPRSVTEGGGRYETEPLSTLSHYLLPAAEHLGQRLSNRDLFNLARHAENLREGAGLTYNDLYRAIERNESFSPELLLNQMRVIIELDRARDLNSGFVAPTVFSSFPGVYERPYAEQVRFNEALAAVLAEARRGNWNHRHLTWEIDRIFEDHGIRWREGELTFESAFGATSEVARPWVSVRGEVREPYPSESPATWNQARGREHGFWGRFSGSGLYWLLGRLNEEGVLPPIDPSLVRDLMRYETGSTRGDAPAREYLISPIVRSVREEGRFHSELVANQLTLMAEYSRRYFDAPRAPTPEIFRLFPEMHRLSAEQQTQLSVTLRALLEIVREDRVIYEREIELLFDVQCRAHGVRVVEGTIRFEEAPTAERARELGPGMIPMTGPFEPVVERAELEGRDSANWRFLGRQGLLFLAARASHGWKGEPFWTEDFLGWEGYRDKLTVHRFDPYDFVSGLIGLDYFHAGLLVSQVKLVAVLSEKHRAWKSPIILKYYEEMHRRSPAEQGYLARVLEALQEHLGDALFTSEKGFNSDVIRFLEERGVREQDGRLDVEIREMRPRRESDSQGTGSSAGRASLPEGFFPVREGSEAPSDPYSKNGKKPREVENGHWKSLEKNGLMWLLSRLHELDWEKEGGGLGGEPAAVVGVLDLNFLAQYSKKGGRRSVQSVYVNLVTAIREQDHFLASLAAHQLQLVLVLSKVYRDIAPPEIVYTFPQMHRLSPERQLQVDQALVQVIDYLETRGKTGPRKDIPPEIQRICSENGIRIEDGTLSVEEAGEPVPAS